MAKKPAARKRGDRGLVDMDLTDDGSDDEASCPIPDDDGWIRLKKRQPEPRAATPKPADRKGRRK